MVGRHRSTAARSALTLRRSRFVELVDVRTAVAHWITQTALDAGRRGGGRYLAVCGADVLPASMTEPGRGPCQPCRATLIPAQRSRNTPR